MGKSTRRAEPRRRATSAGSAALNDAAPMGPDLADQIAAAWLRERPGTPISSIGVVTRLWAVGKLLREQRQRSLAAAGVDAATLDLLSTIRRAGEPYTLTTREITDRTLVTAGAISQRITRAEKAGLVTRQAEGRTVKVSLTKHGHEVVEQTVDIVLMSDDEQLSSLTVEQQATLADLLTVLLRDLESREHVSPHSR